MDFADLLKNLTDKANKLQNQSMTEEATKNSLILPFLQALGYDVFNPMEVHPEFTSDVGLKKGEKVDFAILIDNEPVILIECKTITDKLDKADSQLLRYFHTTSAKFGILCNGIVYKFYTDLEQPNLMDEKPFLVIDLFNLREQDIVELKKFHKSNFNISQIISTANELKYLNEIKSLLTVLAENPTEDFTKFFISQVYSGRATASVIEQFKILVRKSLSQWTSEIVSNRIKQVLDKEKESEKAEAVKAATADTSKGVETTVEELECFYIIKGILRQNISSERIFYRDSLSYFSIIIDNNNRKPICRLYLNSPKKSIGIFDELKKENRFEITSLDDIFKLSEPLLKIASTYK